MARTVKASTNKESVTAKRPPTVTPAAPKPSKEELRAQVEKLEHANAFLRGKQREANRTAKTSAARIAELEAQVAELERKAAVSTSPSKRKSQPAKPARVSRRASGVDPGDAVPPGVAVQEPARLDEEAETALENLEEHLGHN